MGILRVGIDLDSTLNNLTEMWVEAYNEKHRESLTLSEVTEWDLTKFMTKEEDIYSLITEGLLTRLTPLENSQYVTKMLAQTEGVELYIVTASDLSTMGIKVKWLEFFFPHIERDNIIAVKDKSLVLVDVLIDDNIDNLTNGMAEGILLSQPWNLITDVDLEDFYINRAEDWSDVLHYMGAIVKSYLGRDVFEHRRYGGIQ